MGKRKGVCLETEEGVYNSQMGTSNASILSAPSHKKKSNRKVDARGKILVDEKKRVLSKKKRKLVEKMAERKSKRVNREQILEELKKFQLSSEELTSLQSVAKMQQKQPTGKLRTIAGSKKKRGHEDCGDGAPDLKSPGAWQTTPYFETDSSSSDSDLEPDDRVKGLEEMKQAEEQQNLPSQGDLHEAESVKEEEADPELERVPSPDKKKDVEERRVWAEERIPAVHVPVLRREGVETERMKLPILAEEQAIVEAVKENSFVIICGETGSGKTTQVPQFLYEAGFARNGRLIGVTEPRRVAAISMSQRVGEEMNVSSDVVSYQIRFQGNVTERTEIKFMTDGVLMKELQSDVRLSKYSVIIVDEAHERSMYSDILIGLLSRIVPMRLRKGDPLKLVIMSATLRVEDFTQPHLFAREPAIIKVDSRQFPVTIYFNKKTPVRNYLKAVYKKVCRIHDQLPAGGILVFLSGQREVHTLIKWLTATYPLNNRPPPPNIAEKPSKKHRKFGKKASKFPTVDLDSYSVDVDNIIKTNPTGSKSVSPVGCGGRSGVDLDEVGAGDDMDLFEEDLGDSGWDFPEEGGRDNPQPLHCLPMYSLLPTEDQARVFLPPPPSSRLCVVSTNVAETSLTIPDIKYVVDGGKQKRRLFDPLTGVSRFQVGWTSKASANQRTGRAGRTGPGHCYRLYSSAVFNNEMEDFSSPDILNKPVEELILQMKAMNIVKVRNFPFPTSPDPRALEVGERRLITIGALEMTRKRVSESGREEEAQARITALGRTLALFPVKPEYGKILALANQRGLMPYAVCLVAALSVREPLINPSNLESKESRDDMLKYIRKRREWAGKGQGLLLGDLSVLLGAVGSAEFEGFNNKFCRENGLRYKALTEIRKLRNQLTNLLNSACDLGSGEEIVLSSTMAPPSDEQFRLLRQIVFAGLAENVAKRCNAGEGKEKGAYAAMGMGDSVFIHPTSVLYKREPDWVLYQEIIHGAQKKYMQTVCETQSEWFPVFAEKLCNFGDRVQDTEPFYSSTTDEIKQTLACTFGPNGWKIQNSQRTCPIDLLWYKWLAVEILEGTVFPKLKSFRPKLLASPKSVVKSWAHLQPRTKGIVNALIASESENKQSILEEWDREPQFLFKQYSDWIPESLHPTVASMWPPR